ncbi:MAG: hypothetical protein Kow0027_12590 [Saprospiraceae bacterium]
MQPDVVEINPERSSKPDLMKDVQDRIERILGRTPTEAELRVFAYAWLDSHHFTAPNFSENQNGRTNLPLAGGRMAVAIGKDLHCLIQLRQNPPSETSAEAAGIERLAFQLSGVREALRLQYLADGAFSHENYQPFPKGGGNGIGASQDEVLELSIGIAERSHLILSTAPEPEDALLLAELPEEEELPAFIAELSACQAVRQLELCVNADFVENLTRLCLHSGLGATICLDDLPVNPAGIFIVAKREKLQALVDLFSAHRLACAHAGALRVAALLEVFRNGEKNVSVPLAPLRTEHALRIAETGSGLYKGNGEKRPLPPALNLKDVALPRNLVEVSRRLFASQKRSNGGRIGEDGLSSSQSPDALVFALDDANRKMAATVATPPSWALYDPFLAGMVMVAESARRIACSGASPVAVSVSLNLESPGSFELLLENGIRDACRKLGIAYHFERPKRSRGAVLPAIGMAGVVPENTEEVTTGFAEDGDLIYMLGNSYNDLHGSEYLRVIDGTVQTPPPHFDLQEESEVQEHVLNLIRKGVVRSAHGVGAGGLFACLVECAISGGHGFDVETVETFRKDCFLFGESHSRVVLSIDPLAEDEILKYLLTSNVSFTKLGEVLGQELIVDAINFGSLPEWKAMMDKSMTPGVHH